MHEHFYNVAYIIIEKGVSNGQGSCLLRTSRVPTLDSVKNHIRTHFLKDSKALISISEVAGISKEVFLKLGGDANAPLLKSEW